MELEQQRPIEVALFADEIKPDSAKSPWCYLGLTSVPMTALDHVKGKLRAARTTTGYQREIKFHKIKRAKNARSVCAENWLPLIIEKDHEVKWSVLGIDTSKLRLERFGSGKAEQLVSIQRRFLRATVRHHLKSFYRSKGRAVHVKRFFHDTEGRLEADPFFPWHAINWLEANDQGITFAEREIRFVHSDQEREEKQKGASHLIQLCDVLLGTMQHAHLDTQLVHHPTSDPKKRKFPERDRLAEMMHPLLDRMLCPQLSQNKYSRFGYVGRCNLSFFPSRELTEEEFEDAYTRAQSSFYSFEVFKGLERERKQQGLGL